MTTPLHPDIAGPVGKPKDAIGSRHVIVNGTRVGLAERLRQRQRAERRTTVADFELLLGRGSKWEFAMWSGLCPLLEWVEVIRDNIDRVQLVLDERNERLRQRCERRFA